MNKLFLEIDPNKYPLINKINTDFLDVILKDIFDNGYSNYIKGLMNNTNNNLINILNSTPENETNNKITDNKTSSSKGQLGENLVYDIIIEKFPDLIIENTSRIPHSGDLQLTLSSGNKIICEIKNYNKTVDSHELEKMKFDMKFNNIYYGIFVSLNSGIVGKKRVDIETFYHNKSHYYIFYIPYASHRIIPTRKYIISHNSIDETILNLSVKLESIICIFINLSNNVLMHTVKNKIFKSSLNDLIIELNNYYMDFGNVKQSALKLEDNLKKTLDYHMNTIKEHENTLKKRINSLINFHCNIDKIKISDNKFIDNINVTQVSDSMWDFENNIYRGKIIVINDLYDVLITAETHIWNEQFLNFNDCIDYINNIVC